MAVAETANLLRQLATQVDEDDAVEAFGCLLELTNDERSSHALAREGAPQAAVAAMRAHSHSTAAVDAACPALFQLSMSPELSALLVEGGAIPTLLSILEVHGISSANRANWCCRTLAHLTMSPGSCAEVRGGVSMLAGILRAQWHVPQVADAVCLVLRNLAADSLGWWLIIQCNTAGTKAADLKPTAQAQSKGKAKGKGKGEGKGKGASTAAVAAPAETEADGDASLRTMSIPAMLIALMRRHADQPIVCESACWVLVNLSSRVGGCRAVLAACPDPLTLFHGQQAHPRVCEALCWLLTNVTADEGELANHASVSKAAQPVLVSVLRAHAADPYVVEAAGSAIANTCVPGLAGPDFAKCDGPQMLVSLLRRYVSVDTSKGPDRPAGFDSDVDLDVVLGNVVSLLGNLLAATELTNYALGKLGEGPGVIESLLRPLLDSLRIMAAPGSDSDAASACASDGPPSLLRALGEDITGAVCKFATVRRLVAFRVGGAFSGPAGPRIAKRAQSLPIWDEVLAVAVQQLRRLQMAEERRSRADGGGETEEEPPSKGKAALLEAMAALQTALSKGEAQLAERAVDAALSLANKEKAAEAELAGPSGGRAVTDAAAPAANMALYEQLRGIKVARMLDGTLRAIYELVEGAVLRDGRLRTADLPDVAAGAAAPLVAVIRRWCKAAEASPPKAAKLRLPFQVMQAMACAANGSAWLARAGAVAALSELLRLGLRLPTRDGSFDSDSDPAAVTRDTADVLVAMCEHAEARLACQLGGLLPLLFDLLTRHIAVGDLAIPLLCVIFKLIGGRGAASAGASASAAGAPASAAGGAGAASAVTGASAGATASAAGGAGAGAASVASVPSVPSAAASAASVPSVPSAAASAASVPSVPSAAASVASVPSVPSAAASAASVPSVTSAAAETGASATAGAVAVSDAAVDWSTGDFSSDTNEESGRRLAACPGAAKTLVEALMRYSSKDEARDWVLRLITMMSLCESGKALLAAAKAVGTLRLIKKRFGDPTAPPVAPKPSSAASSLPAATESPAAMFSAMAENLWKISAPSVPCYDPSAARLASIALDELSDDPQDKLAGDLLGSAVSTVTTAAAGVSSASVAVASASRTRQAKATSKVSRAGRP